MRHLANNLATHAIANIYNAVNGVYHNKVSEFFSNCLHIDHNANCPCINRTINSTDFTTFFLLITREIIDVPCHGAGSGLWTTCECYTGRVAAAGLSLAAFQTIVEEDEGSLPRLSQRGSKGLTQPTSVEGGEGRGERGWSEPPTRSTGGATRHATPKRLWWLFVSQSDTIFREVEGHALQSLHLVLISFQWW